MAINTTTLSGAITSYTTTIPLTSTTNVTAPVLTTGSGMTWLYVEQELMWVTGVPQSGTATVTRGMLGTKAVAHLTATNVTIGTPSDFPVFTPQVGAFQTEVVNRYIGTGAVVASAATIVAPSTFFHVSGTTATNIITPPANFVGGEITIIADGAWSFTLSAVTNGIVSSSTAAMVAGSMIKFFYDMNTQRWYPSRNAG